MELNSYSKAELTAFYEDCQKQYTAFQAENLKLDMSRGKPSPKQLDLSNELLNCVSAEDMTSEAGDCRNYGGFDGISEAKKLFAPMVGVEPDEVFMFGNASLQAMYFAISYAFTHGIMGNTPWGKLDKVKFLCPVPGYDRHFRITEFFGVEMINIPTNENGPDMDLVEKYVSEDEAVKGIWCVPQYSNPSGIVYSDEVVKRFAGLKPLAKDFRIFWDNAYGVHHLYDGSQDYLIEILEECKKAGSPDLVYKFSSTSKITFPGSGIAAIATSLNNLEEIKAQLTYQTIGHDKVNQLRHVRFFGDIAGIKAHMKKHAAIIRPKFEAVIEALERDLEPVGVGTWTNPKGGYFISFDAPDGCAKAIVDRAKKAGVTMTKAGATYPYGKDPHDSNIRIAPTFPSLADLKLAMSVFTVCVRIVAIDKLLKEMA